MKTIDRVIACVAFTLAPVVVVALLILGTYATGQQGINVKPTKTAPKVSVSEYLSEVVDGRERCWEIVGYGADHRPMLGREVDPKTFQPLADHQPVNKAGPKCGACKCGCDKTGVCKCGRKCDCECGCHASGKCGCGKKKAADPIPSPPGCPHCPKGGKP